VKKKKEKLKKTGDRKKWRELEFWADGENPGSAWTNGLLLLALASTRKSKVFNSLSTDSLDRDGSSMF
jgi:hypothetical protein